MLRWHVVVESHVPSAHADHEHTLRVQLEIGTNITDHIQRVPQVNYWQCYGQQVNLVMHRIIKIIVFARLKLDRYFLKDIVAHLVQLV